MARVTLSQRVWLLLSSGAQEGAQSPGAGVPHKLSDLMHTLSLVAQMYDLLDLYFAALQLMLPR